MALRSAGPDGDADPDWRVYALIGLVALLLITGYVVLAVAGRDTTGYVLLLGGPAMTSIIGAVISRKVRAVAVAVADVQTAAAALADDELPAVHRHLQIQDLTLGEISLAVVGPPDPPAELEEEPAPSGRMIPLSRLPLPAQDHVRRP